MFRSLSALALLAVALPSLVACAPSDRERCAQSAKPAECLQVADAGGDVGDYLLYGMAGYMLSSALNGNGQRQTVIVQDPSYHGYRRPIPSYVAPRPLAQRSKVTTTTTTTKRGLFGGSKTTTRTSTWSSRPSYSRPSYSRPSYSSRRR